MELYNADTGSLLCHSVPIRGQSDELYDEHGLRRAWLLVHPSLPLGRSDCLASSATTTPSATSEMASWQMRILVVPKHRLFVDDEPEE